MAPDEPVRDIPAERRRVLRGGPDSLDPRQKAKLLAMAQSWISLADLAERNSHLDRIDETPPRRESPIH
jgi:hypothetical protein